MKRLCSFQTVLFAVARARGMRPTAEGIPVDVSETLAEGITEAYAESVQYRDWPEALELVQIAVETDAGSGLPYLPRRLANGVVLNAVHGIWDKHPAEASARCLAYKLEPLGYYLREPVTLVWVKYRPDAPRFTCDEFELNGHYSAKDVVYDPETGHSYEAIQNTSGYPVTDDTRWKVQPLLDVLRLAVIAGATGHLLRSEGQDQTARGYELKMLDRLENEALSLDSAEQQRDTYRNR